MSLSEFINQDPVYPLDILKGIVTEAHIDELRSNTDIERLRKAEEEVRTNPPTLYEYADGSDKLEFNFKAYPSKEMKRHKGFVIHKEGEIQKVYCDCKDFYYRLWAPLVEAGLSSYTLASKYITDATKSHTHGWTSRTNPDGNIYICKHLAAMRKYI